MGFDIFYFVCTHSFNVFQRIVVCVYLEHAESSYIGEHSQGPLFILIAVLSPCQSSLETRGPNLNRSSTDGGNGTLVSREISVDISSGTSSRKNMQPDFINFTDASFRSISTICCTPSSRD